MRMSVLEWLHRNPGAHDLAVIARATGFNQRVVDRALTYHIGVGQVVRIGGPDNIARYRSADSPLTAEGATAAETPRGQVPMSLTRMKTPASRRRGEKGINITFLDGV
jgi:hypothetical protein